jgi:N-acyl homoserine lactone hydrolase
MSIRAEAIPLEGPLPGGVEGTSVTVEPIHAGTATFSSQFFEYEGGIANRLRARLGPRDMSVPVPVYLVRHPAAGHILIDTGLHPSVANNPRDNMGRVFERFFSVEPGQDLVSKLRAKGIGPADIHVVLMTHLHNDHASGISNFSDATFVLSEAEWEHAQKPKLIEGYRAAHYDHAFDYCTVDFDAENVESYGPFGRTFDLFGDGSVRLAFTPGHSAGHQSVIAHLRDRDFVIAGDTIYTHGQLDDAPEPPRPVDRHTWRRSRQELALFARQYPQAVIVPGHDPEHWQTLDAKYE